MQYYAIMLARVSKNPVQPCTIKTQVDIPGTLPKGPKVSSLNISCWEEEKASVSKDLVLLAACSNRALAEAGSTS